VIRPWCPKRCCAALAVKRLHALNRRATAAGTRGGTLPMHTAVLASCDKRGNTQTRPSTHGPFSVPISVACEADPLSPCRQTESATDTSAPGNRSPLTPKWSEITGQTPPPPPPRIPSGLPSAPRPAHARPAPSTGTDTGAGSKGAPPSGLRARAASRAPCPTSPTSSTSWPRRRTASRGACWPWPARTWPSRRTCAR